MQKGGKMVRENCIRVTLSEKEKEMLRKKAEQAGVTMSCYIRQALIKGGK